MIGGRNEQRNFIPVPFQLKDMDGLPVFSGVEVIPFGMPKPLMEGLQKPG